jgi:hypothetical protein
MADFFEELLGFGPEDQEPDATLEEADEDASDFVRQCLADAGPLRTDLADKEEVKRKLLVKFPESDVQYLEYIVSYASDQHIWAMLRQKSDPRVDVLIHKFLRQRTLTTEDRKKVGGNGVDWTYLRDTGLLTTRKADGNSGYLYELDWVNFDQNRGARDNLTSKDRDLVLRKHSNRCNFCGSAKDLQADHRVGVAIAGSQAGGEIDKYQALCRMCNLNKRVACGKCPMQNPSDCAGCGWAYPENHTHIAGEPGTLMILRLRPGSSAQGVHRLLEREGFLGV